MLLYKVVDYYIIINIKTFSSFHPYTPTLCVFWAKFAKFSKPDNAQLASRVNANFKLTANTHFCGPFTQSTSNTHSGNRILFTQKAHSPSHPNRISYSHTPVEGAQDEFVFLCHRLQHMTRICIETNSREQFPLARIITDNGFLIIWLIMWLVGRAELCTFRVHQYSDQYKKLDIGRQTAMIDMRVGIDRNRRIFVVYHRTHLSSRSCPHLTRVYDM